MEWEWPVVGDRQRRLLLDYEDMFGSRTSREVLPICFRGARTRSRGDGRTRDDVELFEALCCLKKDRRTFRISNIRSLADAETGEMLDPWQWAKAHIDQNVGGRIDPAADNQVAQARRAIDMPRSTTGPASPQVAPARNPPKRPFWRWLVFAVLIGYMIGRMRVLHLVVHHFRWRHGLWL